MISFSEAQQLIIQQAKSFGKEKISLDAATNRVLAENIFADRDYPPFNRATMDGYAISFQAWKEGVRKFKLVETIYAGKESTIEIKADECYKIMTGAAVPFPADIVIRKEDATEQEGSVSFSIEKINPFQSIAKQGEDLKKNALISSQSKLCTPALIGILAAIGKNEIIVEQLPKISILTTGDEVVSVNSNVNPVQIRNSNMHVLKALLKKWNIDPVICKHIADDKEKLTNVLAASLAGDIIILNGAVSAGDADYVPEILQQLGAKKIFHKVAIRPGRPLWFGKFENGPIVFGLPGNPFSCIVTFKIFIEIFLKYSFGLNADNTFSFSLNGTRKKNSSLDEFFPVKINRKSMAVEPLPFNTSGDITAALDADAIAHHPVDVPELLNGTNVKCYQLL